MIEGGDPGIDALIVTALGLERTAVRRHLSDLRSVSAEGVIADAGRFTNGSHELSVRVIETGQGNVNAALAVERALADRRPRLVILCGIAGGVKDVAIGDVVASSKVYWVEGGKEGATVRPRPDQAPVSQTLVHLARTVAADGRWLARAEAAGGGAWTGGAAAFVGPIAAGERVITNAASRTGQLIADMYGDSLCLAMEDFGALRAVGARDGIQAIAVRAVSDLLNNKSTTDALGAQPLAAANAAAFTFELLALHANLSSDATASAQGLLRSAQNLLDLAVALYPQGPLQEAVWQRAGGDVSRLNLSGQDGRTQWWHAITLVRNGGGNLAEGDLLRVFAADHPRHPAFLMP